VYSDHHQGSGEEPTSPVTMWFDMSMAKSRPLQLVSLDGEPQRNERIEREIDQPGRSPEVLKRC